MLEFLIVLLVIVLDQLAKYFTQVYLMPLGTSYPLWEGVFHITSAQNTGAAFSMLAGARWFFVGIAAIAGIGIILLLVKYRPHMHLLMRICLMLILAGAWGNMIDRILLGYVRDMLDFRLVNFAIFNVADSAVSVGAALLALDILFGKGKRLLEEMEKNSKRPEPVETDNTEQERPEGVLLTQETIEKREDIPPEDVGAAHGDS